MALRRSSLTWPSIGNPVHIEAPKEKRGILRPCSLPWCPPRGDGPGVAQGAEEGNRWFYLCTISVVNKSYLPTYLRPLNHGFCLDQA